MYEISERPNSWISSRFCYCSQQGFIGPTSRSANVQGTVDGPRLFLLSINDIVKGVDSHIRMSADDSLVSRQIHTPADNVTLESNLNQLLYCVKTLALMCRFVICYKEEHIGIRLLFGKSTDPPLDNHDYLGDTINTKCS